MNDEEKSNRQNEVIVLTLDSAFCTFISNFVCVCCIANGEWLCLRALVAIMKFTFTYSVAFAKTALW